MYVYVHASTKKIKTRENEESDNDPWNGATLFLIYERTAEKLGLVSLSFQNSFSLFGSSAFYEWFVASSVV